MPKVPNLAGGVKDNPLKYHCFLRTTEMAEGPGRLAGPLAGLNLSESG
jgi:hypothetical protein